MDNIKSDLPEEFLSLNSNDMINRIEMAKAKCALVDASIQENNDEVEETLGDFWVQFCRSILFFLQIDNVLASKLATRSRVTQQKVQISS